MKVCIVVPCYNEEGVLDHTTTVLLGELNAMAGAGLCTADSFLCLVDDGSRDRTWADIERLAQGEARILGLKLSANFGHQNALIAGLFSQRGRADVLVTIDADLQDDVNVISEMVRLHHQGKRIVYGVREDRNVDPLGKRIAARVFYAMMKRMNDRAIKGHADFRSADAGVIADLERFNEANIYLRGVFPLIGYESALVRYVRKDRHAGESKYSYRKLMSLAWQGITSFTTTPLKLVLYLGALMFVISGCIGLWIVWGLATGTAVQGWASTVMVIMLFSSMNMVSLGIIGEYIGKIYKEVKQRPRYIIDRTTQQPHG
ncbi:MAG: glycosyltransferase family 2 protein [Flavobacteriales bacterium]|nr:glycosyltransferase family 2 protein [Flavobacteriales bacterium]